MTRRQVLGTLYALPESRQERGYTPLSRRSRTRLLAELARIDAQLEALATGQRMTAAGRLQPIGPLARKVAINSARKYRNRLTRAL